MRCVPVAAAQWALDGRKEIPSASEFRSRVVSTAAKMVAGAREYSIAATRADRIAGPVWKRIGLCVCIARRRPRQLYRFEESFITETVHHVPSLSWRPRLVPSVAGSWWQGNACPILGCQSAGWFREAYYLMHARRPGLNRYHDGLSAAFSAARRVACKDTVIVQLVAFSDPGRQVPRYLSVNGFVRFPGMPVKRASRFH